MSHRKFEGYSQSDQCTQATLMLPQNAGPTTRQRTALGDISNRGFNQFKDGKAAAGKASRRTIPADAHGC